MAILDFPIYASGSNIGAPYSSSGQLWIWDGEKWGKPSSQVDISGKDHITTGSLIPGYSQSVTGSLQVSKLVATGSLLGTSSYSRVAFWAISSSNVDTSSVSMQAYNALTASYVENAPELQRVLTSGNTSTIDLFISASINNGLNNQAIGLYSHAEGKNTITDLLAEYSHAEGGYTTTLDSYAHSEGYLTTAVSEASHAEGYLTTAVASGSHAEGELTISKAVYSHAEGTGSKASGDYSHAEGYIVESRGGASHAEGHRNVSVGTYSHAEGGLTVSFGDISHAEGFRTEAVGYASHTEGDVTTALGAYSHTEGIGTVSISDHQHVQGKYNYVTSGSAAFILGDGTDDLNRKNLVYAANGVVQITGSLKAPNITGSLLGSASYALVSSAALSASYSISSSIASSSISSSYSLNSFNAISASKAQSSSYALSSSQAITSSNALTASSLNVLNQVVQITGSISVFGPITASVFTTVYTTSSVSTITGSSKFGSDVNNNYHEFTGSVSITSSLSVSDRVTANSFTGSLLGTASYVPSLQQVSTVGSTTSASIKIQNASGTSKGTSSFSNGEYSLIADNSIQGVVYNAYLNYNGEGATIFHTTKNTISDNLDIELSVSPSGSLIDVVDNFSALASRVNVVASNIDITSSLVKIKTISATGSLFGTSSWSISSSWSPEVATLQSVSTRNNGVSSSIDIYSGNINNTTGSSTFSHGYQVIALGTGSYSQGHKVSSLADYSHAEGSGSIAGGNYSHAEGDNTLATGSYSHAEGDRSTSIGISSHAEGYNNISIGDYSHAEGSITTAIGSGSHAEGTQNITFGTGSHAEGQTNLAIGNHSHVEGNLNTSKGLYSHAEGYFSLAAGQSSHTEGSNTTAIGGYSHAEGLGTTSKGEYSHTEGESTIAGGPYQTVVGGYNIELADSDAFIIGNGSTGNRSNLLFAKGNTVQLSGSLIVSGGNMFGYLNGTASYALNGGTGGTNIVFSDAAPSFTGSGITSGSLWYNTLDTSLYINYVDSDGPQWVGVNSANYIPTASLAKTASYINTEYLSVFRSGSQPQGTSGVEKTFLPNIIEAQNGIAYNSGSGEFTLTAGKVYKIQASLAAAWTSATNVGYWYWLADASNTRINAKQGFTDNTATSTNWTNTTAYTAIVAPATTQNYKIRCVDSSNAGAILSYQSWIVVTSI